MVMELIEDEARPRSINDAIATMIGGDHNFEDEAEWDTIVSAVGKFLQTNAAIWESHKINIANINTYIGKKIVSEPPPPPSEPPPLGEEELEEILQADPLALSEAETAEVLIPGYDGADESFDMMNVKMYYENRDYLKNVKNLMELTSLLYPYKDMYTPAILHRVLLIVAIIKAHLDVHKDNLARLVGVMIAPIDTIEKALTEEGQAQVSDGSLSSMSLAGDICRHFGLSLLRMGPQRIPV